MKAIDFFCGAGGLTRGLLDAGLEVKAGYDFNANCHDAYSFNNPGSIFHESDIQHLTARRIRSDIGDRSFREYVFVGCAPCQPFSPQQKGRVRGAEGRLLTEFGRLVEDLAPRAVLVENVPGMAKVKGNSTFKRFVSTLKRNGYSIDVAVLDAKGFGVPQTRRRLVLLAFKGKSVCLPVPSYGKGRRNYRTVRDAIEHFPVLGAGQSVEEVANHRAASLTDINLERLSNTPSDGGDRRSWPESLQLKCHSNGYKGHTDVYGRLAWDQPAPTLTGRCHSISNGRYAHPEQNRAISLREAAALQSFPDNYEFFGRLTHIALQIGNAVPVRFAEALAKQLVRCESDPGEQDSD